MSNTRIQRFAIFILLSACSFFGSVGSVFSQEGQIRQTETQPEPLAELLKGQIIDTNQTVEAEKQTGDLGRQILLRRRPRRRMFQVYSDTQLGYSSNVLLADDVTTPRQEDTFVMQTFEASFSPRLVRKLKTTFYVREQLVRYDDLSPFDFDSQTVGLNLARPVKTYFTIYGGFAAKRAYFRATDSEFFKMYDTHIGLYREQPVGRMGALFYGYQLDWRESSPSALARVDNAGYWGVNLVVIDKLTAQVLYRIRGQEYLQADRTDFDHQVNFALIYGFSEYVRARAFFSYYSNDSNIPTRDFHGFTTGGGLYLSVKF
jgi:hypothetical protein